MFSPRIDYIKWCYSEYQPTLPNSVKNVSFHNGYSDRLVERENLPNGQGLIILDDIADTISPKSIGNLFTKISHHRNISVFFLVQNLYYRGLPNMRLLNLNSHYTGKYSTVQYSIVLFLFLKSLISYSCVQERSG